jgi:hypothetical protein
VLGARQHLDVIRLGEVGSQHQHGRQMDLSGSELFEEQRKST